MFQNGGDSLRRIVITGMGAITPIGNDKDTFFDSLLAGRSGAATITNFDPSGYSSTIAAEIKNFDSSEVIEPKKLRHLDKFTQFAIMAAKEAIDDADLEISEDNASRIGVIVGSGIGGLRTLEDQHEILMTKGPRRVSPYLVPMMIPDLAAGQISIYFGAKGPNWCPVSACATGTHAIGEAMETIRRGAADICIAGGSEAPVTPLGVAGFASARALTTRNDDPAKASRPFELNRDGFLIGEGAGILILEALESAKDRGVNIYAEVVGYGASGDAYHITSPDISGDGAARSMNIALDEARLSAGDIDYVNAHGTSTKMNDSLETTALKKVFKDRAYDLKISSTKSMTGHLLGAAGGIEAIASVLAIKYNKIPPTINLDEPDPECDLNYVPNKAISADVNVAMSNSFGFGGHNATVIVSRF